MLTPFRNEALTDFTLPENRAAFEKAMVKVKAELGRELPAVINGQEIWNGEGFVSINPARPAEVVARFPKLGIEHAEQAIKAAAEAFKTWQYVPVQERAGYILHAAGEMRRRKQEFNAVMVLEVGKSWAEADADTSESIDFLEYYARQALRIADSSEMLIPYPGEQNGLYYIPLGVGVVISPWNFPNAIATGMTAAALVTGNTVCFKPAEPSSWIAAKICELFWESGIPHGVLNFLPGKGSVIGAHMVEHPQTRFIAFTGSKEVGLRLFEQAGQTKPGQLWLKRTILEMGGKDAVVVDETANLEAASVGIVQSAFGFQGQKCSAGSRAIIVDSVYEQVVGRAAELASKLTVGAPDTSAWIDQGPVVDANSFKKILDYIELGTQEGKLLLGGSPMDTPDKGYFIPPTIFGDVDGNARIAQEEIFGPVLACVRASDYDHALQIANSTEFGLTGALFSLNRQRLERARREFHVGNLYFNRKCTGAMVGAHPFGGFNMSGTDSKAGGPDYLLLFTQAKLVSERL